MKERNWQKRQRNKWADIEWQSQCFTLIKDNIYRDNIDKYWKDKPIGSLRG